MSKSAIIKWNSESLSNIKNNLLFFDNLYYDPYLYLLYDKLFENISKLIKHKSQIPNQIISTQEYLKNKKILNEFDFNTFKKDPTNFKNITKNQYDKLLLEINNYDIQHKKFLSIYNETVELLSKDYQNGYLKFIQLFDDFDRFADSHLRISKVFLEFKNSSSIIPLISNIQNEEVDNKFTTIKFVLNKLPTPSNDVPLDEIIDFKTDNKRKYLALINWVNKISRDNYNLQELSEEYEYLDMELTESIKILNKQKKLDRLEIFLKTPLEFAENIIKINWSKIPGLFIEIERNKLLYYEKEFDISGKEIAYIFRANENFK